MVSGTHLGSIFGRSPEMEIRTVDLAASGINFTSAVKQSFPESVQKTTKDAIKRKLTARVSPMTRKTEQVSDTRVNLQVSCGRNSQHSNDNFGKKEFSLGSNFSSTAPSNSSRAQSSQKRLAEKRKLPSTNIIVPAKTTNSNSSNKTREEKHIKRPRAILPRTSISQAQVPTPEAPKTPLSPEPKLMSDNVATMSLLSASECHLAALQDEDGDTPLHIAIAHGNTQLIEYLISLMSCLSLDIYNNLKQTPLHLAVITGQAYIVGKLITAGANPNMPDRNGQTPAHLACQRSSLTCLEELFKGQDGMDPDLKNFSGFTPLHEAVFASCTETVKCLVKHGANVNSKDGKSGRTPLHHAVEAENVELIEELLKCGANPSEPAFSGNTPLQIASGRCMQNIRGLLEANTSKPAVIGKFKLIPQRPAVQQMTVTVPQYVYQDSRGVVLKNTYA